MTDVAFCKGQKFRGKLQTCKHPAKYVKNLQKGVYLNKYQITLKISFQNFNLATDKFSEHSIL